MLRNSVFSLLWERQSINKVHTGYQFRFRLPVNKPQSSAVHQGDEEASVAAQCPRWPFLFSFDLKKCQPSLDTFEISALWHANPVSGLARIHISCFYLISLSLFFRSLG